jgi:hypothetical protein
MATGYGLDDAGFGVRVPVGSGTHPVSYPMGTGGLFPWGYSGRDLKLIIYLKLVR